MYLQVYLGLASFLWFGMGDQVTKGEYNNLIERDNYEKSVTVAILFLTFVYVQHPFLFVQPLSPSTPLQY